MTRLKYALVALLCIGSSVLVGYLFLGHAIIADAYRGSSFPLLSRLLAHHTGHPLGLFLERADTFVLVLAMAWITAALVLQRLIRRPSPRGRAVVDALFFVANLGLFFGIFASMGTERHWYVLSHVMAFTAGPPYQHRLLFVVMAQLLRKLHPIATVLQAFLATQLIVMVLALWAVKLWAGLFIEDDFAFVAQFLTVAVWALTLSYFTFYDIGILFVYSICLYYLFRRQYVPYMMMLALGTYNHEITLLLIVTSAFVLRGQMDTRRLVGFVALQLAIYVAVRASLFYWIPMSRAWQPGRVDRNLAEFFDEPLFLVSRLWHVVMWYTLAFFGLRHAPSSLRRCLVLLPCLLVTTFLFGQYNESRQFDAFIPIVVALLICWIAARIGAPAVPSAEAAASRPAVGDLVDAGRSMARAVSPSLRIATAAIVPS